MLSLWMSHSALVTGAALALSTPFGTALAETPDPLLEQRTMTVHYGDLDLATASGQAKLETRLRRAAARVCATNEDMRPLVELQAARACYDAAMDHAHQTLASAQSRRTLAR